MTDSGEAAARRLASVIDRHRIELGLSKRDLGRIARVSRPTVSLLINHATVPMRGDTLERIGAALGWAPGSCRDVLAGGEPTTLRAAAGDAARQELVVERLQEIAREAGAAAAEAERQVARLRSIGEQALAAARLALSSERSGVATEAKTNGHVSSSPD